MGLLDTRVFKIMYAHAGLFSKLTEVILLDVHQVLFVDFMNSKGKYVRSLFSKKVNGLSVSTISVERLRDLNSNFPLERNYMKKCPYF